MEAVRASDASANLYQTARRHIPEDSTLHSHRCENFKSHLGLMPFLVLLLFSAFFLHGTEKRMLHYLSFHLLILKMNFNEFWCWEFVLKSAEQIAVDTVGST
jgi:hypothetical protein